MLTVALPKGRIAEETLAIFEKIFGKSFLFDDRKLILEVGEFRFLLVRNQDVPAYVLHQSADIGVVGLDVLEEKDEDLVRLLDLGIGKCKVCVGMRDDEELNYNSPDIKIATKMVNITQNYFSKKAMAVDVIKLYGSIELAPLVGLADAIVDIVETGTTMKQNGLKVVETIMESSAHLIANKNSFIEKKEEIISLYRKISEEIKKK
ncbi:ATP phosphoribosyltransferase [Sulfurospirillum arcachonense]|uniref:ATP phosphoribosyltransferase n=1 Tax=Sulfurospirillum arcachonense TaxID=57666 RepID=UPI00046837CE|nr:ATP phosphoribosyltransferase [Sulfurospirillum arcachonense]